MSDQMPLVTVELAEHGDSEEQTLLRFHLEGQGQAGASSDEDVHNGWTEALELLAERVVEAVR